MVLSKAWVYKYNDTKINWRQKNSSNINIVTVRLFILLLTSYPAFFLISVFVDHQQPQTHHQTLNSELTEAGGARSHQSSVGFPMGLPCDLTVSASSDLLTLASAPRAHSWIIFFLDISTLFVDPYVSSILHESAGSYNKSPILLLSYWFCFPEWTLTDMRGRINNLGRSKKLGE